MAEAQLDRVLPGTGPGFQIVSPPLALRDHELSLFSHKAVSLLNEL